MDPVAFVIFGMEIYWYGIFVTGGIIVAFILATFIMKKLGFREEIVFEALLVVVPIAIFGARFWYVIVEGVPITNFFNFRDGGLAIYGGIIFGALGLLIYTLAIRKCSFFAISDVVVVVLILAQSIGRWGNFFNEEIYGLATGDFHFFPLTVMIGNSPHLALFFYESILNLIGFVFLFMLFRKQKKYGTTSAAYFIIYGVVRAILEPLRMPTYQMMVGPIPVSVVLSVLAVALGIVLLVLNKYNKLSQKDITLRPKKEEDKKKKK